jgi:hypothetical protein
MNEHSEFVDRIIKKLRDPDDNMMCFLEDKTGEEIEELILELLSPNWLKDLREDAEDAGNNEVVWLIDHVVASYLETYTVAFSHWDSINNYAAVVRFQIDGEMYYHVDYGLDGTPEGQFTMLFRKTDSSWDSKHSYIDYDILKSIGIAIDWHENYRPPR